MDTQRQLHQQRRALIRHCRGVEFDLAIAVVGRDSIAADSCDLSTTGCW